MLHNSNTCIYTYSRKQICGTLTEDRVNIITWNGYPGKTESAKKIKPKATDHWIQSSIITNFHLSSSIPWLGSPSPNTKEKTYGKTISKSLFFIRNRRKVRTERRNSFASHTDSMKFVLSPSVCILRLL